MAETALAVPKPTSDAMDKVVKAMVASRLFPDVRDAAAAYARIHLGRSLGVNDFSAMTGIFISQGGKPALSANLMAQIIKGYTPKGFPGPKYRFEVGKHDNKLCEIKCIERVDDYTAEGKRIWKWKEVGVSSFSEDDAKQAGLIGGKNETWKKYTRNLLFARAISNAAKWYFSDAFGQMPVYLPDELPDSDVKVNPETLEAEVIASRPAPTAELTRKQILAALIADAGADLAKLLSFYKVDGLDELDDAQTDHAIDTLQKRLAAK